MAALAALCLFAGSLQVSLPQTQFTLRWQHSIEKIEWAEDYEVAGAWLHLSQARIRGSGAGMEPPDGATLVHGVWNYRLADPWRREIVLARSEFVPDYELCLDGICQRLTHWLPIAAGPTTVRACDARRFAVPLAIRPLGSVFARRTMFSVDRNHAVVAELLNDHEEHLPLVLIER